MEGSVDVRAEVGIKNREGLTVEPAPLNGFDE
jgi:hypothetical protein